MSSWNLPERKLVSSIAQTNRSTDIDGSSVIFAVIGSLATRLCVDPDLRLEEDLIDPEFGDRPRVRIWNLGELHGDALAELCKFLFCLFSFFLVRDAGSELRLAGFVEIDG